MGRFNIPSGSSLLGKPVQQLKSQLSSVKSSGIEMPKIDIPSIDTSKFDAMASSISNVSMDSVNNIDFNKISGVNTNINPGDAIAKAKANSAGNNIGDLSGLKQQLQNANLSSVIESKINSNKLKSKTSLPEKLSGAAKNIKMPDINTGELATKTIDTLIQKIDSIDVEQISNKIVDVIK